MPLPVAPDAGGATRVTVPDITQRWVVRGPSTELIIGRKDSYGALWFWEDMDGWFSTPALDAPITPLGISDRAVAAKRFPRKERYITIKGVCHVETEDDNWSARERLVTAWDSPNEEFWLVVEEPTPKRMRVRTVGPIDMSWNQEEYLSFAFEIPLVGVDPFKYGIDPITGTTSPVAGGDYGLVFNWTFPLIWDQGSGSAPGTMSLFNQGNADTDLTMTVTGPIERGWSVANDSTGEFIAFDVALGAGQTIVIDSATHSATINGASVNVKISGDWFKLKKGTNILRFSTPQFNDDAVLSVLAYPAWK